MCYSFDVMVYNFYTFIARCYVQLVVVKRNISFKYLVLFMYKNVLTLYMQKFMFPWQTVMSLVIM